MKLVKASLTIFISSLLLFGCTQRIPPKECYHPNLRVIDIPELPRFTRAMIDCGNDSLVLDLCLKIKEREIILHDHIETMEIMIEMHNNSLGDKSGAD